MITFQPHVDTREVKVDWYWDSRKPIEDDGKLEEVYPHFILSEQYYVWEEAVW
jgi:hypothetical protein